MHNRRDHLGTRFEVRTDQWTWFWRVFNPHHNGGAVGAAASEADAVREARVAIEEMSAPCGGDAPFGSCAGDLGFDSVIAREARRRVWTCRLDRVAEYLANA